MSTYHEGEVAVQEQAGVRTMSERVGNGIHAEIPEAAREFLSQQPFVVIGARDEVSGRVWASALFGAPGFAEAVDEHTVILAASPDADDPLQCVLSDGTEAAPVAVGLLAIEPATRRRMRLNGDARAVGTGLILTAREVYANCPKYIQARSFTAAGPLEDSPDQVHPVISDRPRHRTTLTPTQAAWVSGADTFFIASIHPESGADASHRGGSPGFLQVGADGKTLLFPDYSGNTMFNTLGNITATGVAGLLFISWQTGDLLQLSGDARVLWDDPRAAGFPGAERLVEFTLREAVERSAVAPLRSVGTVEYSRFNPV
ncbi:MAG: pyridoxamine 5'-phosphate oxidase family protein [Cytophagales bacterium]|nr:pyridoxamine 5'-phosphate oxidase family protein [Armatimonadota bacterium]